ncbi:MAG: archaetidylserine decarboxylase [Legionella sp.]
MITDYVKTSTQFLLPKRRLTALAGLLANVRLPIVKNCLIKHFIKAYQVNMSEAQEESPINYPTFNDFFIRRLKSNVRIIADADIVSPVDGYISEVGCIDSGTLIQAKGHYYSVTDLLGGDKGYAQQFQQGRFATLYLSPQDYHRVHMPLDATLKKMVYLPGRLFSVQPRTARVIPNLFARNERLVVLFDTQIGPMAMVLVGAAIVGTIGTSWHGDVTRGRHPIEFNYNSDGDIATAFKKISEMGYFKLGSTVILLFAQGHKMQWLINSQKSNQIRLGEPLGRFS